MIGDEGTGGDDLGRGSAADYREQCGISCRWSCGQHGVDRVEGWIIGRCGRAELVGSAVTGQIHRPSPEGIGAAVAQSGQRPGLDPIGDHQRGHRVGLDTVSSTTSSPSS